MLTKVNLKHGLTNPNQNNTYQKERWSRYGKEA